MIVTASDMYSAFLLGINKENTNTVFPDEFNILINESQMEYVKNHYPDEERVQKRIDDLREIKVISVPILPTSLNTFPLPYDPTQTTTGDFGYLFMLRAVFSINYVNNICNLKGTSAFLRATPIKTVNEDIDDLDPYKRPKDDRLKYEIVGNNVILHTGTSSFGAAAVFEYLKYPVYILIDQNGNTVQDTTLSIHCRQEIVDIAVRKYLEYTESKRYQTNINENKSVIT